MNPKGRWRISTPCRRLHTIWPILEFMPMFPAYGNYPTPAAWAAPTNVTTAPTRSSISGDLTPIKSIAWSTNWLNWFRATRSNMYRSSTPISSSTASALWPSPEGIIASGVRFKWDFQTSTDFLALMSDEEVRLLAESGVYHIGFGTESASQEVLALMNKRFQHVEQMVETARKTNLAGINVVFNIILGYPGETDAQRQQTFRVMSEIAREYPNVSFSPNIFTPYPGIPIWPQLKEMGVREPQIARGVGDSRPGHECAALAARGGVATAAPKSGVLPAEQPDPQGRKKNSVVAAKCPADSWCARSLANRQEPLLVSMGTVAVAHRGESRDATFAVDWAASGRAYAGSVLIAD